MKQDDDKYKNINRLNTDFRAEAVAAGLMESGQEADRVLIVRQDGHKRHSSKDIAEIRKGFSQADLTEYLEYLYIHTNRFGIYDSIPENIFHQPTGTGKKKSWENVAHEMRRSREETREAHKFFQPFEMAIDRLLIDAQLYERQFDKKNFHSNLKDIFSSYWSVLSLLTLKQAFFFVKTVPVLHQISADFDLLGKLMGAILEVPVTVELGNVEKVKANLPMKVRDGEWRLGINSALENSFKDGYKDISITIGPALPETIKSFAEGTDNHQVLEQLIAMMLPANRQKRVKYKTLEAYAGFRLSDSTHNTWLGINTRLS
jgi:hypothetical protein